MNTIISNQDQFESSNLNLFFPISLTDEQLIFTTFLKKRSWHTLKIKLKNLKAETCFIRKTGVCDHVDHVVLSMTVVFCQARGKISATLD